MKRKDQKREFIENLFLHPKPVGMLTVLKNDSITYATQVSKAVDCTYSHTVKILEIFRKLGLVTFEKKGRIKLVKLTNDGQEIAHDFEGILRKFQRISSNLKEPPKPKKR